LGRWDSTGRQMVFWLLCWRLMTNEKNKILRHLMQILTLPHEDVLFFFWASLQ
jgi:hypothetical protein